MQLILLGSPHILPHTFHQLWSYFPWHRALCLRRHKADGVRLWASSSSRYLWDFIHCRDSEKGHFKKWKDWEEWQFSCIYYNLSYFIFPPSLHSWLHSFAVAKGKLSVKSILVLQMKTHSDSRFTEAVFLALLSLATVWRHYCVCHSDVLTMLFLSEFM